MGVEPDRVPRDMADDTQRLVPDYDHMPVGALHYRIRALDVVELRALRAYEAAHAQRQGVIAMIDTRLAQLQAASVVAPRSSPEPTTRGRERTALRGTEPL
ncbi:hypothetical protein GCM10023148_40420 [Actinokineospora soli]